MSNNTDAIDYEFDLFVDFLSRGIHSSCIDTVGKLEVFKKMLVEIESLIDDFEEALVEQRADSENEES